MLQEFQGLTFCPYANAASALPSQTFPQPRVVFATLCVWSKVNFLIEDLCPLLIFKMKITLLTPSPKYHLISIQRW